MKKKDRIKPGDIIMYRRNFYTILDVDETRTSYVTHEGIITYAHFSQDRWPWLDVGWIFL